MNPLPLVLSMLRADRRLNLMLVILIMIATGLGVAILSQERALKQASARAVDKFDLIVAAPGSITDVTLKSLFLRPGSVELLRPEVVRQLLADNRAIFAAPLAFGDSVNGDPVVGTTRDLVMRLADGRLAEGRGFEDWEEAVVGQASPLKVGETFQTNHGHGPEETAGDLHHASTFTVVGRLPAQGSPWDRAVIIPVEQIWKLHNLPAGHAPQAGSVLGPPFDEAYLTGVPAMVVKPENLAAAYGLRNVYRTEASTAFFPAEVLVGLYQILGDIRVMMTALASGTQTLVSAAVIACVMILLRVHRRRFAVLRALGAPKTYVFACIWLYVASIVVAGTVTGLMLGLAGSHLAGLFLANQTGIALSPSIGRQEVVLAALIVAIGLVFALAPAWSLYRDRVDRTLQS
ncbi:FtsX-like permease family protein [Ensifer adhaerens]|uniref:FtsX-like permease family protein n=1 Tax=Ensifer adhaerens TaxID=106592 RepID=UPI001C4E1DA1|nr:ABC transporter permease [Ensifer adhaerens]MBW0368322.1 ABC transporter permease [Ensifer adhaerens]UCM24936.1 ABC transporter permease [Ensifer adhaerens]